MATAKDLSAPREGCHARTGGFAVGFSHDTKTANRCALFPDYALYNREYWPHNHVARSRFLSSKEARHGAFDSPTLADGISLLDNAVRRCGAFVGAW